MDEVLIELKDDRLRAACVSAGQLLDVVTEKLEARGAPGSIYLGRVVHGVPGLRGAFVDIGLDRPALLDVDEAPPPEGTTLPVQVIEPASGDKACRVSRRLALEGSFAVLLPGTDRVFVSRRIFDETVRRRLQQQAQALKSPGEGLILRTAAASATPEALAAGITALRARWAVLKTAIETAAAPSCVLDDGDGLVRILRRFASSPPPRLVFDDAMLALRTRTAAERVFGIAPEIEVEARPGAAFDRHGVADILATAEAKTVRLPSGGRITIEPTAALTAIDVDTGEAAALGAAAPLRVDIEAASEIGRQLWLRDLGGMIVVDFVRLNDTPQRAEVAAALHSATARDRVGVQLVGWTAAGLFEIIRPRTRGVERGE